MRHILHLFRQNHHVHTIFTKLCKLIGTKCHAMFSLCLDTGIDDYDTNDSLQILQSYCDETKIHNDISFSCDIFTRTKNAYMSI